MIHFSNDRFIIRDITDITEMKLLEQMQADVWGMEDCSEIVPKDFLKIAAVNGGVLIGAYDQQNNILGFLFGFIGLKADGRIKHCSHMMGILPPYQKSGIGVRLKMVQRQIVRKQGIDLITWTVNPMEGVNAALNFGKLGVVCQNYLPNFYGEMEDDLNKGIPSHRFEAEWWIRSARVEKFMANLENSARLNVEFTPEDVFVDRLVKNGGVEQLLPIEQIGNVEGRLVLEVPSDFQRIKTMDPSRALDLLTYTNQFFTEATARGFIVADFVSRVEAGERRNYYLLERDLNSILARV